MDFALRQRLFQFSNLSLSEVGVVIEPQHLFLLMIAVVALVGCGKKDDGNTGVVNPNKLSPKAAFEKLITNPIFENAIRRQLKKSGHLELVFPKPAELTKADLEKVTMLNLAYNKLTGVKGLEISHISTQITQLSPRLIL